MKKPYFSIIIPTKNRPELLRDAIRSVLCQNFKDYELIVSDNFNDESTIKVIKGFLSNKHLKYIRTNSELNMPDHWEWMTLKASGKYVLILTDRSVLIQNSLNTIFSSIKKSGEKSVYSWGWNLYDNKNNVIFGDFLFPKNNLISMKSKDVIKNFLEPSSCFQYALPRGLNSCYRADVAKKIRNQYKKLFIPINPDFASAFMLLSQINELYYINQPLFLSQGLKISNGGKSVLSTALPYIETLGNINCYTHVPIKTPLVENLIFDDFIKIQKLTNKTTENEIDWIEYFIRCYKELLQKKKSKFIDKENLKFLQKEFYRALFQFDSEIQKKVYKKIKKMYFLKIKFYLKNSFLGYFLINLILSLKRKHKSILEAAGFNL